MKSEIEFNEFLEIEKKLEIKVGIITEVERMPKSDKMLKLTVDLGESHPRTVMTNIGNHEGLEDEQVLVNYQCPFITNLKPTKIMGVMSSAMIMPPVVDGKVQLDAQPGNTLL